MFTCTRTRKILIKLFFSIQEEHLLTYLSLKPQSHILLLHAGKSTSANPSIPKIYLSQFREQELSTYQSITFQHNFKQENEGEGRFEGSPGGTRGIDLKHRVDPLLAK